MFKLSLWVLVLVVVIFVWIKGLTLFKAAELKHLNNKIERKEKQIEEYEASEWYKKFLAVKWLEDRNAGMSWYERIEKISEIFDDLRNINEWADSELDLSDFNVSLEEVSLKWTVSSLKDLYYTNASWRIKAVLEKFENLDFIEKMTIKDYSKVDGWFEFSLYANVIQNGGK